jgi:hypothetical protein
MKIRAKNSKSKKNNKILPKKNTIINNKIECIGFKTPITKIAQVKQQPLTHKKKNSIYKYFSG